MVKAQTEEVDRRRQVLTEQLAADALRTVQQMTAQEKTRIRMYLDGIFAEADREFLRSMGIASTMLTDRYGQKLARELPPIPEGHYRLRTSDGAIHDIPAENIGRARAIDPLLIVLNPFDFWG
jgi:hypothetical protein